MAIGTLNGRPPRKRSASLKDVATLGVATTRSFHGQKVDRVRAFRRGLTIAKQLKKAACIGIGIGTAVVALSLVSHPLAAILSGIGARPRPSFCRSDSGSATPPGR